MFEGFAKKEAKNNDDRNRVMRVTAIGAKADGLVRELFSVMGMDPTCDYVAGRMGHYVCKTYQFEADGNVNVERGKVIKHMIYEYCKGEFQILYRGGNFCNVVIMEQWK